jgi:tetratricopeptide (TPR) repeat protein
VKFLFSVAFIFVSAAIAEDVVHIKDHDPVEGEIQFINEEKVTLKTTIELAPGQFGSRTVDIAAKFIDFIEFEPLPGETEILADPAAADLSALEALWDAKRVHLGRPRSNAGQVAMAYAERLLEVDSEIQRQTAHEIFEKVEKNDWNRENEQLAKQGRLRALIALGQIEEAIGEAEKMAEESEDPRALIEAKFVLGIAEFNQLKALEEEHPKWMEDDEVRPKRNEHYNNALDRFLFSYLFYGSEETASARGLWMAAEVYSLAKDTRNAQRCAEDIVRLYPNTIFKPRAEQLLLSYSETP